MCDRRKWVFRAVYLSMVHEFQPSLDLWLSVRLSNLTFTKKFTNMGLCLLLPYTKLKTVEKTFTNNTFFPPTSTCWLRD